MIALATAYAAGLVSTVNPCGFAMLPAYLGYFLGLEDGANPGKRALRVGGVVSLGFLVVFGIMGVLIVSGLRSLVDWIPWAALVVGVGLIGMGIYTWTGRYVGLRLPSIEAKTDNRSDRSVFVFGVSYAVASLSCTLPIFLTLVAGTFTQSSFAAGMAAFLAYGAGMATVLLAITVGIAFGKDSLLKRIRRMAPHLSKISGAVLVLAGGFIVWYWATILASGAVALSDSGVVRSIDEVSAFLTNFVANRTGWVAGGALLIVVAGALFARRPRTDAQVSAPLEGGAGRAKRGLMG